MSSGAKISAGFVVGVVITRYAFAVIAAAVAVVLRWWLEGAFGPLPLFITFYPAVLLVASIVGGGPGILTAMLSALAAVYWFVGPIGSFRIDAPNDVLAVGIFTGANLFLCILAERLRRARWAEATNVAQQQQLEESARLNEELSQQSEELSQQSEELVQQNEELQTQSEEIQTLNTELKHREDMLQKLLDAARLGTAERAVMLDVCTAAKEMFGPAASAVIVLEPQGNRLAVRAQAGLGPEGAKVESLPSVNCFAELVIAENRTAALADASLRPDLSMIHVPGEQPFQAVLAAPMRTEGRPFGVVGIYSWQTQEWTSEQFRLVEWLAAQCTHILETLRLQAQTRRQAALIDLSPAAIIVRNLDGTITFWSRGAQTLYGWTEEEARSRCTHELFQTRFPEPLEQIIAQLQQTGRWSGELIHRTKDGREVVVQSWWLGQLDAQGQVADILESNVDITDRKRAEEVLQRTAEDLARSNKDLEQFAYVASHDLKEPLRMVTGFMSLLKDHCQGKLDAKSDEYVSFASDAAARMQGLIDDLLAYSRVGRGERSEPTDIGAVLDRVLRSLTVSIEESAAVITHDPLPTITSNPVELTQLFQNLIGNAIKFKGERKPEIHVGAQRQPRGWLFTVRDNGIGIDQQFADRIFMIFQRLHTRDQYPGTGIGLAICKKIVERHGGRIWMESQPEKGSTFCFTIPDRGKGRA